MGTEQSAKNKNVVLNVVIVAVAALIAFNIYKKQETNKAALNVKIKEEKQKSVVLEEISKEEKNVSAYKKLLYKKDSTLVMATVTNMAKGFGIQIISVKPVAEIRQAEYVKFPFVMTVSAPTYHALGKFISTLENSKDVYIFDSVDISTSENEANKLTATLMLSTIALTD